MAVSKEIFDQLQPQIAEPEPEKKDSAQDGKTRIVQEAERGWSAIDSARKSAEEILSAVGVGAVRSAESLSRSVAELSPGFMPGQTVAGGGNRVPLTEALKVRPEAIQRTDNPETVIGQIGTHMAQGVGVMATMPILGAGALARNVIAGAGMGEGEWLGKKVIGGVLGYFSPQNKPLAEAVGSIVGGGLGAQANISRVAGMSEMFKQPIDAISKIKPAYQAARTAQAAGDERKLWQIFADEFGNLRASTRGIIEQYTNNELASAIRRDIRASTNAENFIKDSKMAQMESEVAMTGPGGQQQMVKPWGLGERTMVPAITRLSKERVPKTFTEGIEMDVQTRARQQAIANAYNKLAGPKPPATDEGAEAAGKVLQKMTQAKVDALSAEQGQVKATFPNLTTSAEHDLGEVARQRRNALEAEQRGIVSGNYAKAEEMFNAEGIKIPTGEIAQDAKAILKEFYSKIDPRETVPPVVENLIGAVQKNVKAGPSLILPEPLAAEQLARQAAAETATKDLSLKDANDLVRALNNAASNALRADQLVKYNRANEIKQSLFAAIDKTKASPEAKQAYADARDYYATKYAPRFREDLGKALDKDVGGAYAGAQAIKGESVMEKSIRNESGAANWDVIFGSDPAAQQARRTALEGRFRDKVLTGTKTPEALESKLDQFRKDYSAGLSRLPEVAAKIDQQAAKTLTLMNEQKAEIARYKDIMGGDVSRAIGPVQAKEMYQRVLSDPLKMDALLKAMPKNKGDAAAKMVKEVWLQANPMKNGNYDGAALLDMLFAGKDKPAMQSSMEKLFEAAYGKDGGKRHMDTLEAIAGFTQREAATNPRNLRPGSLFSESPVKEASGQSMASWISAWRAQEMGVTGSTYFTTLGLSRFANAKAQAAVEKAKLKALYDPDTAEAILELAATPSSQPIGLSTARKIFGDIRLADGKKLVDRLLDRGYVKKYIGRGIIYGAEKAQQDQQEAR